MTELHKQKLAFLVFAVVMALMSMFLTGCLSTSVYRTQVINTPDGQVAKSIKAFSIQGNIQGSFTLSTTADGAASLTVNPLNLDQIAYSYIAATNGKGDPLFDDAGNPVYNTIPFVAGLDHTSPTTAFWAGLNKSFRSLGSVIGTIGASLFGIEAANQLGGAVNTGVNQF